MMIQLLEKSTKGGEKVLDIGTGTGVLAIAAVKLGVKSCVAIDNDDWSIDTARENNNKNDTGSEIELVKGDLTSIPNSEFDIIVANLNRNTLLYLKNDIYTRCKKGGILLLSGILTLDEESVVESYASVGFVSSEVFHEAEWSALAFKK